MRIGIKRACPSCHEKVLDENILEKGGLLRTTKCPECGKGCVRLNVFYWPLYPLIDITFLLIIFAMFGASWGAIALSLLIGYGVLVYKLRLNERFGPIFKWHGI